MKRLISGGIIAVIGLILAAANHPFGPARSIREHQLWALGIICLGGGFILAVFGARYVFEHLQSQRDEPDTTTTVSIVPGQYFQARGTNVLLIYGECLEHMAPNIIYAKCYSRMCPTGESGTFQVDRIMRIIDKDEFMFAINHLG